MVMQVDASGHTAEDALTHALLQIISPKELQYFQQQAEEKQQMLFHYLLQYQFVDPEVFLKTCAAIFKLPAADYKKNSIIHVKKISDDVIRTHFFLPLHYHDNQLTIAIANPNDITLANKIAFQAGVTIALVLMRYDVLCQLHNLFVSNLVYAAQNKKNIIQELASQILSDAIHQRASDIHLETFQKEVRLRFRLDGLLREIIRFPSMISDLLISCIKVMAQMDIAIKRLPQDGRFSFRSYLGFYKDCRVSTCPTLYNEKMVIRLLDTSTQIRPIEQLGLNCHAQKTILKSIAHPQGFVLVTGPTGSGKTITLYTLLNVLNRSHRNISTIEDPIEMQIDGINQTPVNIKMGLTFSQTLRALLRQDPDVMMIGEIRDKETAEMALSAAQTGHLVLSTLHTNSAAEALTRLDHMGIAPFYLNSALLLIIAQRLVRKLCSYCKIEKKLDGAVIFEANTCGQCNDGYAGRIGIFELLAITPEIQTLILHRAPIDEIEKQNKKNGYQSLWEAGMQCVTQGVTSISELYRVVSIDR